MQINLLGSREAMSKLKMMFKKSHSCIVKCISVCRLAASKLVIY